MAAGTMTLTEVTHGTVKKIKAVWTSGTVADGGKASATTTNAYSGRIIGACTVPDSTTAPTDNYDITVKDVDGVDIALGALLDRDTANTEYVSEASMAGVAHSTLTIAVENAGDGKKGTIYLYIR
jgi:6,7-dimethyl-8-ribityllumazine synthase